MKNFKKDIFYKGCSNICVIPLVEPILPHIVPKTIDLLTHFRAIMNERGIKFENLNETIYHATHLALTFIHIKDLKKELKEFKNEIKNAKKQHLVIP